jgi:hypothetical protein
MRLNCVWEVSGSNPSQYTDCLEVCHGPHFARWPVWVLASTPTVFEVCHGPHFGRWPVWVLASTPTVFEVCHGPHFGRWPVWVLVSTPNVLTICVVFLSLLRQIMGQCLKQVTFILVYYWISSSPLHGSGLHLLACTVCLVAKSSLQSNTALISKQGPTVRMLHLAEYVSRRM